METAAFITGLRFLDSFFPSGGFAYSSGLEAAVQGGLVKNADELSRYVTDLFQNGIGRRDAVAVARAWDVQARGDKGNKGAAEAIEADWELEAMKLGRESRLASRQMGRQVVRLAADQLAISPIVQEFRAAVDRESTPGHLPIAMGLTLGAAGWDREMAIAGSLYQTAVGFVSAGLKLLPMGQRDGQRLLEQWTPVIERISRSVRADQSFTSWTPVQDIYAMRHSRLESRLFRS